MNAPVKKRKVRIRETWKHKDVFESFLLMGPTRSFKQLSELTGLTTATLHSWEREFDWKGQLAERDAKTLTTVEGDNDKIYLEKVKKRHQQCYIDITDKAMRQIKKKKLSFESDKDAAIAADIGIKGERDVLGLRDNKFKLGFAKEGFAALMEMVSNG